MKRQGNPKTNAERRITHTHKYGAKSPLPKRGTGLRKKDEFKKLLQIES